MSDNPLVILLMPNLILLVLGMIMDMAALIFITTPIFLPVVVGPGMDPVQFGIIVTMNLGLGLTTPPVEACLFVGCAIGEVKIQGEDDLAVLPGDFRGADADHLSGGDFHDAA